MITLVQHVENLKRFTEDTEEEIITSILHNRLVMNDSSLLSYSVDKNIFGTWITIMWIDGDGKEIYQWISDIQKEHKCDKTFFVSKRWKAMSRKYKELNIKPLGVLCEMGVI